MCSVVTKVGMQAALKMNNVGEGQNGLGYEVNVLRSESSQHANNHTTVVHESCTYWFCKAKEALGLSSHHVGWTWKWKIPKIKWLLMKINIPCYHERMAVVQLRTVRSLSLPGVMGLMEGVGGDEVPWFEPSYTGSKRKEHRSRWPCYYFEKLRMCFQPTF